MGKFMKLLFLLCALCAFTVGATLYADTIKPDICDVQTTFKIAGVDKTKVVTATGTNTAIKLTTVSLVSGSSTVASGLTTVTGALFMPSITSTGTNTANFEYLVSGTNVVFYAYNSNGGTSTSDYVGTALILGTP